MEPFPKFPLMKNYFDVLDVLHAQKIYRKSRTELNFQVIVLKEYLILLYLQRNATRI